MTAEGPAKAGAARRARTGLAQLPAQLPEMMLALTRMQAALAGAALRQQIEGLEFLKERLERDLRFVADLAAARDAQALAVLWAEFWRHAAEDYAAEAGRQGAILRAAVAHELDAIAGEAAHLLDEVRATAV
ncbi:MAG: hypothetical protein N2422_00310 [Rhodobacteraceae bacterium]|nr:hypothetical protein [Paracoccaceae bacterium]